MKRTTMQFRTNLLGLKKLAGKKNLKGYFIYEGRELTNAEVRKIVDYGIDHGYEFDVDIPGEEIEQILNWK